MNITCIVQPNFMINLLNSHLNYKLLLNVHYRDYMLSNCCGPKVHVFI